MIELIGWLIFACILYFPVFLGLTVVPLAIIAILTKRRGHVGKTWDGPIEATVHINDKQLICPHCQHDRFAKRESILATTYIALFHLSCFNQSVPSYVCKNCGNIQRFLKPKEKAVMHRIPDNEKEVKKAVRPEPAA